MKIKGWIWGILLFACGSAQAYDQVRWQNLYDLSIKEEKTIKRNKIQGPELLHRLFEVYSERIKLLKEKENHRFLTLSTSGKKIGKDKAFSQSNQMYDKTRTFGLGIINKYSNYRRVADLYYTLAINSRDYSSDKRSEEYFKKAVTTSRGDRALVHQSYVGLAEFYYNEKKFQDAIAYYQKVISNTKDQWLSKHYLNLSWCLLKIQKFDFAVNYIHKAYEASKSKKYMDVTEMVFEAIGYFYILKGEPKEGAKFYLSEAKTPIPHLIKMARKIAESNDFENTNFILTRSNSFAREAKQWDDYTQVLLLELELYRSFQKPQLHFATSIKFLQHSQGHKLNSEEFEQGVNLISGYAGFVQLRISKEFSKQRGHNEEELKTVIKYFSILSSLNPKLDYHYTFLKGETYFAIEQFTEAGRFYRASLELLDKQVAAKTAALSPKELDEYRRKMVESLLACISNEAFEKKDLIPYTVYTYNRFLGFWPKDDKSKAIFEKLFNLYFSENLMKNAIDTMERYAQTWPTRLVQQREMMTAVLDYYIKTKDTTAMSVWIIRLRGGFLQFDPGTIQKAEVILGQLLFDEASKLELNGKVDEAIAGYLKLYEDERYPPKIKAESSYKIAVLKLKQKQVEESHRWLLISQQFISGEDTLARIDELESIGGQYVFLQGFTQGADIYERMLDRFCPKNFPNRDEFYVNSIRFRLIEKDLKGAGRTYKRHVNCLSNKSSYNTATNLFIDYFERNEKFKELAYFYKTLDGAQFKIRIVDLMYLQFWSRKALGESTKVFTQFFRDNLADIEGLKGGNKIKTLFDFDEFLRKSGSYVFQLAPKGKEFKEEEFNSNLEKAINYISQFQQEAEALGQGGDQFLTLGLSLEVAGLYERFIAELRQVVPQGMPKDYVDGFKKSMLQVIDQMDGQRLALVSKMKKGILRNDSLTPYNRDYFINDSIKKYGKFEYTPLSKGMTLDKVN